MNDNQKLRVLALGDCNTWGIQEPPVGNTILDKFCNALSQQGTDARGTNLGCGMATTREGIQRMQLDGSAADIVLINFGLVDTWVTSIPQFYVLYYPETRLRKLRRKLLKFVKRHLRAPMLRKFVASGPVVTPDEYADNVRAMIAIARQRNPSTTVILWGSPPVQHDPARNENLARYNRILASIANETQSYYVETSDAINQLPAADAYLDNVHLNEAATDLIAQQLASAFLRQRLAAAG